MSKKVTESPKMAIDELNDSLTRVSTQVQENKKVIMIASVVVIVVVAAILAWVYIVRTPGIQKSNDAYGLAGLEQALGNDSIALAQYMDVADNMSYDGANNSALQAATMLYRDGKYEEALKYVEKYSTKDAVVGAAALSLKGDCLVNLDRLDEAVSAYKAAIKTSDNNPAYTPFFMMKLARVYAEQGNHQAEAEEYGKVVKEYPLYGQQSQIDVEKLYQRALLEAQAK